MKINELSQLSGTEHLRSSSEERQRNTASVSDTQSLSSLASITLREASGTQTCTRPLAELKASLAKAESADPTEIASALLSRGFLTEESQ